MSQQLSIFLDFVEFLSDLDELSLCYSFDRQIGEYLLKDKHDNNLL